MWSWLTSPPALIIGLLASVIAIGQALPVLTRKIVLFPRRRAERQLGQVVMSMFAGLGDKKGVPVEDLSKYRA